MVTERGAKPITQKPITTEDVERGVRLLVSRPIDDLWPIMQRLENSPAFHVLWHDQVSKVIEVLTAEIDLDARGVESFKKVMHDFYRLGFATGLATARHIDEKTEAGTIQ